MTTIATEKASNHLNFLYGIVAYRLFYFLWGSTLPVFMTMERLLHPTAVLIGIVFIGQNPPDDPDFYMKPFIMIDFLCHYLFMILAFILYRKEMWRRQHQPS